MEIKRRYLRKILKNEQKSEVKYALKQIELDIFEPLQEMDVKHLVSLVSVIKGTKTFSEVNQKRFRRSKLYCYSNSINQLSEVNHVILNLSTFYEKNISLSIFEMRALFRLLKRKFDCEVIRISDLNLIHFGDFSSSPKLFRDTLLIYQLKEIAQEIHAVMIVSVSPSYFMTLKDVEEKTAVLIKKKKEAVKNQNYGQAALFRDQIKELHSQIKDSSK